MATENYGIALGMIETRGMVPAIEAADAAGADPEKLRVAREVVASQAVPAKADRFW